MQFRTSEEEGRMFATGRKLTKAAFSGKNEDWSVEAVRNKHITGNSTLGSSASRLGAGGYALIAQGAGAQAVISSRPPLCWTVPIRWRQIFRASMERFVRTRTHLAVILADVLLLLLEGRDTYGILSVPAIRAVLVFSLIGEGVLFLWDLSYQILFYRSYFYDIRDESVVIRRGVICKHEISLPLARITDVYLEQDVLSRLLGLYDLHLSSPTAQSGKVAHMVGIDREGAMSLRRMILELIQRAAAERKSDPGF
jgi:membrane protein YdbS with pleckstrin-like domain